MLVTITDSSDLSRRSRKITCMIGRKHKFEEEKKSWASLFSIKLCIGHV